MTTKPTATIAVSATGIATIIRKATDLDTKIKAVAASGGSAVAVAAVLESLGLNWPGWVIGLLSLVIALAIGYVTKSKVTLPGGSVVDPAAEVDAVLHTEPDGNLTLGLPASDALVPGDGLAAVPDTDEPKHLAAS